METQYVYTKPRSEFGRQCIFSDRPAEIILDIPPNSNELDNYIERSPCEMATQCVKEMSEHEVNTERCEYAVQGVNHVEGGWPKDVNFAEPEQVARFRKKVEKEENYTLQVVDLASKMEKYIKQNNAIDIYEDYFGRSAKEGSATGTSSGTAGGSSGKGASTAAHTSATVPSMDEPPSARTLNVLRDPKKLKRTANHLSWNSDGSKLAVAYCSTESVGWNQIREKTYHVLPLFPGIRWRYFCPGSSNIYSSRPLYSPTPATNLATTAMSGISTRPTSPVRLCRRRTALASLWNTTPRTSTSCLEVA